MSAPRVTIGFPVFNDHHYLPLAFDSLRAQEFTDFEVVVCDNGSSDGSWAICEKYAELDPRWRIERNPVNVGINGNFNKILGLARGEFFRLAAHDDLMAPTLIGRSVEALDAHPEAVLAYPGTVVIDGDGNETTYWDGDIDLTDPSPTRRLVTIAGRWRLANEVMGMVRTEVLRRTDPRSPYLSSDIATMIELVARGPFVRIDEPLFFRRIHAKSTFGAERSKDDVAGWHAETKAPAKRKEPRAGSDYNRLARGIAGSLIKAEDLPWSVRIPGMLAFQSVWAVRRSRIALGRWRRQLTRTPMPTSPWETTS
ncbi:glycosyltransferase involved in cell wall biosynthesis [Allocatelliglobosispora scoriae]|uniref:Glycosyltransferase involved in cell wall biosynthesis n=1 Tax=Allocatelliglobosispora scoriae TaxID=643052 RepID=A0A841BWM3_9ACTN|nr:glycosyltransferase [Allocatelliglobosispora scoriae]MBB5872075.1 glycosyltransferase involved in cell wall biosynthesis [Allocatelliglobosispora scoriae]